MRPPAFGNSPNKQMSGSRLAIASSPICFTELNTRGDDNSIPASTCLNPAASKAPSKSLGTRSSIISASSANARTAVSAAANCAALRVGSPKIAMRESRGTNLFKQPHLFTTQLRDIKTDSRDIAARTRKTLGISHRDRIALQIICNDRNVGRCVPRRGNRRWRCCENYAHIEPN